MNEAAAIPFTRLAGRQFNPGGLVGVEWTWRRWSRVTLYESVSLMGFSHGAMQRALVLGTEVGLRGAIWSGLAAEISLGVGLIQSFAGSPLYAKDSSGSYVQVGDLGKSHFGPSAHVAIGFEFSRIGALPLGVFVQYGGFFEIPASNLAGLLAHATLALSLRYTLTWGSP